MSSISFQSIKIHCNTLHNIFQNLFETTPFDSLGYIYHDEHNNYFGIQSDVALFDKLIGNKLIKKIRCRYSSDKPQTIYAENLNSLQDCNLYETLKSLDYKSVIRITKCQDGKMEIFSFFSKNDFHISLDYFLNNLDEIEYIINNVKRRITPFVNTRYFSQVYTSTKLYQLDPDNLNKMPQKTCNDYLFLCTKQIPLQLNRYPLSREEQEVIILIYYGFTLTEVTEKLEVSRRSVDRRLLSIRKKLKCKSNLNILSKLIN